MAKKRKGSRKPEPGTEAYREYHREVYRTRRREKKLRALRPSRPGEPSLEKKPRGGPPLKAASEVASAQIHLRLPPRDVERLEAVAKAIARATKTRFVVRHYTTKRTGTVSIGEVAREVVLWALSQRGHGKAVARFAAERRTSGRDPGSRG